MSFKVVDERIKKLNLLSGISLFASAVIALAFGLVIGLHNPSGTSNSTNTSGNLTLEFASASRANIDLTGRGTSVFLLPLGEFIVTSNYSFLSVNETGFLSITQPGYYTGNMVLNVTLSPGSSGGVTCAVIVGVSEERLLFPPVSYVYLTSNQQNNNPPSGVVVAPFFFYQTAASPLIPTINCQIFDFLDPEQTFGPISLAINIVKNNGVSLLI
jgi:hypothetical protein